MIFLYDRYMRNLANFCFGVMSCLIGLKLVESDLVYFGVFTPLVVTLFILINKEDLKDESKT